MLRLNKLELTGFKSFADKTKIVFPDRITGIIGPNGCGKSNLSDAIGWVLGLQGARNLRGQKMEDVIFGGTKRRKRSGFTEVLLCLKNNDSVPLKIQGKEFIESQIEIKRRLERSGESHYYINQRRCRLLDIHKLLEDGGLGFASYAMIAQGKIESFLGAKPLERRNLIEEAAQILGYKSKRKNAELKLEMAQQNLLRVNDIISEVERQLRSLKRQANKAARYKKLKQEFREIQKNRLAIEAKRFKAALESVEGRLSAVKKREISAHSELEKNEKLFKETKNDRDHLQEEVDQLREHQSETHLEIDRCQNLIHHSEQQILQYEESIENSQAERDQLVQTVEKLSVETGEISQDFGRLGEEENSVRERLSGQNLRVGEISSRLRNEENHLDELRSRQVELSAEHASVKNLKEQLEQRLKRSTAESDRIRTERKQAYSRLSEAQIESRKRQGVLNELDLNVQKLKARLLGEEQAKKNLESGLGELTEKEKELENSLIGLNERLTSLQEIEVSRSHYSQNVQTVLNHLEKSQSVKTPGTLADSVETNPEFERLVEEFLGDELEYILVESLDDAIRGIPEIRSLESGKCTFFSIHSTNGFGNRLSPGYEGILPGSSEGVFGRLSDLLQMAPELDDAFRRVLPDRAEAIVVSDIDQAMNLAHTYPQSTFITLQGEALTPQGLLSVSAQGTSKLGLLRLKRQKRELEKKISANTKQLQKIQKLIEKLRKDLAGTGLGLQKLNLKLVESEKELISANHGVRELEKEVQREEQSVRVFDFEQEKLSVETEELVQKKERADNRILEVSRDLEALEITLRSGRETIHDLREELDGAQSDLNTTSSEMHLIKERKQSLRSTLDRIANQKTSIENQIDSISDRQQVSRNRIDSLRGKIATTRAALDQNHVEDDRLKSQIEDSKNLLESRLKTLAKLEGVVEELRRKQSSLQQEKSTLEIEQARFETQYLNLEAQCQETLQLPLNLAVSGIDVDQLDLEFIQNHYEKLRDRLDSFGPINMNALTEYQENQNRHQFLVGQKADIETSIADTTRAIQEINRRSTSQFKEAFETVNENFKKIFQELFGGGDCGMRLLDEEDVLECGIDVYAQPPGKRLQNVMLLSGGEKALTVFALLVGIFMYRPSGFCLLDEVDAPLDDANVKRFGELVLSMSKQTQFVLITHNKKTMEITDSLYGITMEEAGVSKVVSAQF